MSKALAGRRIVVTRSAEQAPELAGRLRALGATPIIAPTIRFVPLLSDALDQTFHRLHEYDWLVFTSANAVRFFCRRAEALGVSLRGPRIAASGSATARHLQARGVKPDFVPAEFVGEQLVMGLDLQPGQRVLLPRSRKGRPEIAGLMRAQGARVDDIPLYDTVAAELAPAVRAELEQGFDAITFASPSSVRYFCEMVAKLPAVQAHLNQAVVACIGPVTARAIEQQHMRVTVSPSEYTIPGLCQALAAYYQQRLNVGTFEH